jgi:hypothetical protein
MKRRDFLKLAAIAPAALVVACKSKEPDLDELLTEESSGLPCPGYPEGFEPKVIIDATLETGDYVVQFTPDWIIEHLNKDPFCTSFILEYCGIDGIDYEVNGSPVEFGVVDVTATTRGGKMSAHKQQAAKELIERSFDKIVPASWIMSVSVYSPYRDLTDA